MRIFSGFLISLLLVPSFGHAFEVPAEPIRWRVAGFVAGNSTKWLLRCKMAISENPMVLNSSEPQVVRLSDQENNCLQLLASEVTMTFQDRGPQPAGDRRLDVVVSRVEVDTRAKGPEAGLVAMPHYERQFSWGKRENFGRVLSEDHIQLSCRQYVQTIFGVVNPVGLRTLDCKSTEGSSIGMHIRFADSSLWLR